MMGRPAHPCLLAGVFITVCSLILKRSAVLPMNGPGGAHLCTHYLPSTSSPFWAPWLTKATSYLFSRLLSPPTSCFPRSCPQITICQVQRGTQEPPKTLSVKGQAVNILGFSNHLLPLLYNFLVFVSFVFTTLQKCKNHHQSTGQA